MHNQLILILLVLLHSVVIRKACSLDANCLLPIIESYCLLEEKWHTRDAWLDAKVVIWSRWATRPKKQDEIISRPIFDLVRAWCSILL